VELAATDIDVTMFDAASFGAWLELATAVELIDTAANEALTACIDALDAPTKMLADAAETFAACALAAVAVAADDPTVAVELEAFSV